MQKKKNRKPCKASKMSVSDPEKNDSKAPFFARNWQFIAQYQVFVLDPAVYNDHII